jgi:uncharacterized membrane protein YphA (DoxX/SURF4 family)
MKFLKNDYLHLAVRLLIGALFIYSALPHVFNTMGLAASIANYRLFPPLIIGLSAAFVPWVSLLAGIALILGLKARAASLIISGLLVIFISLALISIARGIDIDCGCFSGIERRTNWLTVFEDLGMLVCSLYLFFYDRARVSLISFLYQRMYRPAKSEGLS